MTTRVALITGGTGEIGTAICRRMAKDGMRVISTCHPAENEAAAQWREDQAADGLHIDTLAVDVSSYEECEEKLTKLLSDYGSVDVIVNCAGITRDSSFKKMQKEQWYDVINVNLNSVFNVTRPLWNAMLEKGFGRVVKISSVNGQPRQFRQANYYAAKAGKQCFNIARGRCIKKN
jgi:acetoacetyl-CoA reductase